MGDDSMEKLLGIMLPALASFVFPAYQSHLAWQKNDVAEKTMWMKYWCFSGLAIVVMDSVGDAITMESIGVYELFKILLFMFSVVPFAGFASQDTRQWGAVMGIAEHLSFIWRGTLSVAIPASVSGG
jgi:nucleoside recognition membrane protein YjiH